MTGVYVNEERAKQLIRFDGMNLGKLGFTDFDAVMEWKDRAWLLFEVKHAGTHLPDGQRKAIERFVADTAFRGKRSIAAVVEHHVTDPTEPVYLRDCMVRSVYVAGEFAWRPPKRLMTAYDLMWDFIGSQGNLVVVPEGSMPIVQTMPTVQTEEVPDDDQR